MKVFFWITWCTILTIAVFLLAGILNMVFHKYNPINVSSVVSATGMLVAGGVLLAASYYLYRAQQIKWACGVVGLPLIGIVLYFFVLLILPYLMGERMN